MTNRIHFEKIRVHSPGDVLSHNLRIALGKILNGSVDIVGAFSGIENDSITNLMG